VKLVFTMLVESSIYKFRPSGPFSTRKGNGVETRQAPEVKAKKRKGNRQHQWVASKSGNSATHKVQQNATVR
jgi:hypothetical protein